MQAKNGSIIATVIICAVLVGLFSWYIQPEVLTQVPAVVPTAAEIASLTASLIVIPEMPEAQDFGVIPGTCRSILKDISEADAIAEVNDEIDDLEDFIEDTVSNFDEIIDSPTLDDSETDVTIDEIGYCEYWNFESGNDDDDKIATVTMEYDFSYENTSTGKEHKDTVYVTATIEYDKGNFNDKDVELVYSL